MAEAVVGSPETLRQYPAIACYINVPTGLLHNKDSLQKLLFLASKNLPVMYIPSSTAGVTSPVTPASSVALDNAGVLVGLVLSQLVQEGAPFIIAGMPPGYLDMRTLVLPYCEPERGLIEAMAHFYGLPMFSLGGVSESKLVDQQAAAEATLSLLITTLAGGHIIHDVGYLESGLTFSFTQLVICHEIINWIKTFARGFEINEEALALDEIARAGPEGQYLNSKHTLNHYRDRWYPEIFERYNYESWTRKGAKNLAARAAEKVEQILAEHKPEPLSARVKEKLRKIVERAKAV
jgi:trimethylamine--corrinoid protein Co-methyltransferase